MDVLDHQNNRPAGAQGFERVANRPIGFRAHRFGVDLLEHRIAPRSAEQERKDVDDFRIVDVMIAESFRHGGSTQLPFIAGEIAAYVL
ncbi:hypothetical protein EOA25_30270 [Mesorhizobium sp. M2A.F.Ca.ET.040.01.1.1]|nr:hypothetical protein EOA25_30270 [Mesorhizobium sp. M2A.F.Ca.ET.040.01.1.1]